MKRIFAPLLTAIAVLVFTATAVAQAFPDPNTPPSDSYSVGFYNSLSYNYGGSSAGGPLRVAVGGGTNSSGVGTLTLDYGMVQLRDGRTFNPFGNSASLPPIAVDSGANYEVVTPSAVSCSTPQIIQTCQVTATFSFAHGTGAIVQSGDQGILEAINDASGKGGGAVFWLIDSGSLTLATGAANTTFGNITVPTRSVVLGATARVITTITGCTGGWGLGFSTGVEWAATNTTLTAGTTTDSSTLATPLVFNAAATAPLVHCTTANASAGAVHARVWGYKEVAPGS